MTYLIPLANCDAGDEERTFRFSFGAYCSARCYVFAPHLEGALEFALQWLDDNAPGLLTTIGPEDYKRAAIELGLPDDDTEGPFWHKVQERAEEDMLMVSHTTLKNGNAIPSWEWGCVEICGAELEALRARVCPDCRAAEVTKPGLCTDCEVIQEP